MARTPELGGGTTDFCVCSISPFSMHKVAASGGEAFMDPKQESNRSVISASYKTVDEDELANFKKSGVGTDGCYAADTSAASDEGCGEGEVPGTWRLRD